MVLEYSDSVRFIRYALFVAALVSGAASRPSVAQQPAPAAAPMFSGVITAISATSVTVVRRESKDAKTFTITPETKFEGPKPQLNAGVTIRYIATDDGDRAVRVIVRAPTKPAKK
jgi:uncharacterized cupredoxin-like copper-binding protein